MKYIKKLLIYLGFLKPEAVLTELTVDNVIKVMENIPHKKWAIHTVFDRDTGNRCFLGHLGVSMGIKLRSTSEALHIPKISEFNNKTRDFIYRVHGGYGASIDVNDSDSINGYTEQCPKDRIMHLLRDMKEHNY